MIFKYNFHFLSHQVHGIAAGEWPSELVRTKNRGESDGEGGGVKGFRNVNPPVTKSLKISRREALRPNMATEEVYDESSR